MSRDTVKVPSSSLTLGWVVWQEWVQKGEAIPNVGNLNTNTIEITCIRKRAKMVSRPRLWVQESGCRRLITTRPPITAMLVHLLLVWELYGGVSYLGSVTGIWVNFKEIIKGKWSHHQSLGFF